MVDETMIQEDFFNDADMADPSALAEGKRYIGYVSGIAEDFAIAKEGQTFSEGRTKVRQIVLTFTALGYAGKGKFGAEDNYYPTATQKFWIGQPDVKSRRWLRRLIEDGSGRSKDEIGKLSILDGAKLLDKTYFTYEVSNKEGNKGGVFSSAVKIKAATAAEVAQVV